MYDKIWIVDMKGLLNMDSNKNRGIPKKGADIDSSSLNLLTVILVTIILLLAILASYFVIMLSARTDVPQNEPDTDKEQQVTDEHPFKVDGIVIELPDTDESKNIISNDLINSDKAILVDLTAGEIVASRQSGQVIYPASMTKVMALIVMVEHLKSEDSLKDKITVTQEMYDRKVSEGHSGDFNTVGEVMTVEDAIYAFILNSDGMMGIGLANYISGSESAFVKLMNEKAEEMGLENTLFQNSTGIHHKYHYTSCYDMALIMAYAMKNPYCAKILSTEKYSTTTSKYKDGITFYHDLLVTRFESKPVSIKKADVIAGKTGYSGNDSGYCVVSYAKGDDGHFYILVTAKADVKFDEITDMATVYNEYLK